MIPALVQLPISALLRNDGGHIKSMAEQLELGGGSLDYQEIAASLCYQPEVMRSLYNDMRNVETLGNDAEYTIENVILREVYSYEFGIIIQYRLKPSKATNKHWMLEVVARTINDTQINESTIDVSDALVHAQHTLAFHRSNADDYFATPHVREDFLKENFWSNLKYVEVSKRQGFIALFNTVQSQPLFSTERDFSQRTLFNLLHLEQLSLRTVKYEMENTIRAQLSEPDKEVATHRMCLVWFLLPEIKNGVARALEALSVAPGGSGYIRAAASFAALQDEQTTQGGDDDVFHDAMEHLS